VTETDLDAIPRKELIQRALAAHHRAEAEQTRRVEAERQLEWFKKQLFGSKSERRAGFEPDPSQLSLGEGLESPEVEPQAEPASVRAHVRRPPHGAKAPDDKGLRFDDSVPVVTIEIPAPELAGDDADQYRVISTHETYRLAQEPAAYKILRYVRPVVQRRDARELSCPPAPASVLPGSYVDVSVLAGMLVDKLRYHVPLYRQHQRMKAAGISVSRTSLTNWVHQAIALLEPVYEAQLASILESPVLAMDETPVRAGRKVKGKMRTAYFWPLYGDRNEVAFPYASSRAHKHVEEILGEFEGTLLSDGFAGYERYAEQRDAVVHAQCWVHARRGFVKAEDVEPERSGRVLDAIGALYAVEAEIAEQGLEGEAKLRARGERCRPVVARLFEWLEQELARSALLPTNAFTKAALYVLDRRAALEVFLDNPHVAPDTNHLERALRVIPMGRKNWLFCWTEVGAEKVGVIQSLITTCVLHEVDPYAYLVDVLQRIDSHPFARVEELTPRRWKELFAKDPLRSDLHSHSP
jgi:transposase